MIQTDISTNTSSRNIVDQDPHEDEISEFDTDSSLVIADIDQDEETSILDNSAGKQADQSKFFLENSAFGGLKLKDVLINKELDHKIEEIILKQDGMWTCKVCGKVLYFHDSPLQAKHNHDEIIKQNNLYFLPQHFQA